MPEQSTKLSDTFANAELSEHGSRWDALWQEEYTPWDRGGPSMALFDVLTDRKDLVPTSQIKESSGISKRKTAFVPGAGRGHDVLLLAAFGYDAIGLDFSSEATKRAIENQRAVENEEIYQPKDGVEKSHITWLTGDFFSDDWLAKACTDGKFDLIFDYTFLCALPLTARPAWAKRMAQLLAPEGRLICLEFPSYKPLSMTGPPWGLQPDTYVALLSHPGEEVSYGEDDVPASRPGRSADGLKRLELIVPARTHKSGYDKDGRVVDFLSVWCH